MKSFSKVISLTKNSRGIYGFDTSIGCKSGMENENGGCYNDCYAAKSAKIYGYDFTKTILRNFKNESHRREILNNINRVKLDFIRIGCSGDPSENWNHAIGIIKQIDTCNKQIVIITRHWTLLNDEQLKYFATINVCVNTSVSALDKPELIERSLTQYYNLKTYCKSILRIISCDFNLDNPIGHKMFKIQSELFKNKDVIDTVFRPSRTNRFVLDGIVNISKGSFMGKSAIVSKYNKKTYTGKCSNCLEMCGVNIKIENQLHPDKRGIYKQTSMLLK